MLRERPDQPERGGRPQPNLGGGKGVVAWTEKIAKREGFGRDPGRRVQESRRTYRQRGEKYAMHVGGHRLPYHGPSPVSMSRLGPIYCRRPAACHMGPQGAALLEQANPSASDPLLEPSKLAAPGEL